MLNLTGAFTFLFAFSSQQKDKYRRRKTNLRYLIDTNINTFWKLQEKFCKIIVDYIRRT